VLAILSVKSEEFTVVTPLISQFIGKLIASFSRSLKNVHKLAQTGICEGEAINEFF
jgi:hypothetical protein